MSIHDEMRLWRSHPRESRKDVLPVELTYLVYSMMEEQEVPLTDEERKAYLRFVHKSIKEVSELYFQGIGE